ncbi:hypothetical protein LWI28_014563 [Acer negundo]|uniref:Aldose 1-epimerase n=1 Tax=Acer negundo TaxID=4023 RepID=A0AAD5I674_ACENE|nr:hypothetical protein LWI28_014563 [Acer negundo]
MKAKALNKATPVNLAQHTYWNLGGHNSGDILSEDIQIFASNYTPVDSQLLPTGKIVSVKRTPYESMISSSPTPSAATSTSLLAVMTLTMCWMANKLKQAAIVHDKKTGRTMELLTSAPGLSGIAEETPNQPL